MSYSQLEKDILKEISNLKYDNANLLDLLKRHTLNDKGLIINMGSKEIKLLVPLKETNWIGTFFETVVFLEDLEKNYWIYTHSNMGGGYPIGNICISNNIDQDFIDKHEKEYAVQYIPTNFFDIIERFSRSYIIPTTKLRELVRHNFKTEEQRNFEREMLITRLSLVIAIIALIFSFCSPFLFDTSIDSEQLKLIIKSIEGNG